MIAAKYKWNLNRLVITPQVKAIANELKVTTLLVAILWQRGLKTVDEIDNFLNPNPNQLRDPFLIHDMQKGIDRIQKAIAEDEKITIYGDYDADGITSTAILYESLLELGANVNYYIPNRFTDGYGPNVKRFQKLIAAGTNLIITVDNGIVGNEAVAMANQKHCDVIITDHHNLPPQLPNAYAIIHARYPGHEYPFGDFSGAGLAFKIACALMDEIPQDLLDLAAIGTVADLVSLTDENRVIVKFGFEALKITQRPGLNALIKKAGLDGKKITEHRIGFQIAPRLNSLGRMGDANVGVELLTTLDPEKGQALADLTDDKNKERQQMVATISKAAFQQVNSNQNHQRHTLVITGDDWHEGVLGIVASRIVDQFHKPTLVLSKQSNGELKGSGRSVEGFDLFKALTPIREKLDKFGGHAMAIGLTISENHLFTLSQQLENYYLKYHSDKSVKPPLNITGRLNLQQINFNFYHDLQRMAPYGTDNEEPVFMIVPQVIDHLMTMGKNNQHLKMLAHQDNATLSVVGFQQGRLKHQLEHFNSHLAFVGNLDLNEWQGQQNLQLKMIDVVSNGVNLIDSRTNILTRPMFINHHYYIFFHSQIAQQVQPFIQGGGQMILADQITAAKTLDDIVFVDCPDDIDDLVRVLKCINTSQMTFYFYHRDGKLRMPDRYDFTRLFQFLAHHPNLEIKKQFNLLIDNLKIPQNLIIFMLQVFKELGFIKVRDGKLNLVNQPSKRTLQSAKAYQVRLKRIQTIKYLFGDQKQLLDFMKKHLNDEK